MEGDRTTPSVVSRSLTTTLLMAVNRRAGKGD